jgi:hypothetical protein
MASKKYKEKDCAYCCRVGVSETPDHVIPRSFFFEEDRSNLPIVPACRACNQRKSELELYVSTALLAGTNHEDGARYRNQEVAPRLRRNARLVREMGLTEPRSWTMINSVIQPTQKIKLDGKKLAKLIELIAKGLFRFHVERPLPLSSSIKASILQHEREPEILLALAEFFPDKSKFFERDIGGQSFVYRVCQSSHHEDLTFWQFTIHDTRIHGRSSPPQGWQKWTAITMPPESELVTL